MRAFGLYEQCALEHYGIFVELGALPRFLPARGRVHARDAEPWFAIVHVPDEFVDQFRFVPAAVMRVGVGIKVGKRPPAVFQLLKITV